MSTSPLLDCEEYCNEINALTIRVKTSVLHRFVEMEERLMK